MNLKSPTELRWMADMMRDAAAELDEAAREIEILRGVILREPTGNEIEEGDQANG